MPSERVQRQIDSLLDEAEQAMRGSDWPLIRARCQQVLALDPDNPDAPAYLQAALRAMGTEAVGSGQSAVGEDALSSPAPVHDVVGEGLVPSRPASGPGPPAEEAGEPNEAAGSRESAVGPRPTTPTPYSPLHTAFVNGRYQVERFLGEGGKKRVYLARDTALRRSVAFALIKTEGLDETGRERIRREGEAMGALGAHPHIVTVFDLGDEQGQPYMTTELMGGDDVEGLIEKAPEHRLPLLDAVRIADEVCRGLEFAHSKGIVHRDLKPGNVWLTEAVGSGQSAIGEAGAGPTADSLLPTALAGTAKIGDFGLAVSLDRTRLTQAGMMVGTVGYMPPEQATGGAVTPRSDLYSLGAMLYEMVCGRPPFLGDDAVAIIGQHLNVPPVSPAWHRRDCPPGLEVLILRLLEKDPARRPGSAGEVRAALHAVAVGNRQSAVGVDGMGPTADSPASEASGLPTASAENPLYRRAFVGREGELRQLAAAYDAGVSGRGSLAMVVGEPGIGKTSVCEQLATYAAVRGGLSLVGHCYEEGSLSLPYLPFVEVMRSYVLQREPAGLAADLGSGAPEVARIVSEVRDRVTVPPAEAGDPEEQRWRLLQAVTGFLRNASLVQPLVLVLEDLHDADRGTLDLLVHLARNLDGARLLIIGTYRDVEVDRSHPLSSALAELRRGQNFLRVPLRGLTAEEVQRMMAAVAQREIPWPFAELVHRQTEGNPLFVQEMLRYLVEEGLVAEREGALRRVGDDSLAGRIPEGLREVIGKRLSRLSEQTNQVLSVASVIGREFRLDVLERVANLSEEQVEAALEQASGVAVVEQRAVPGTVGFRFTHAFFRQTLYEEIFVPRRIRLHQQVARALEAVYGRRVEEHAAELAEHFAQTTDREDLEKALHYARVAAERALSVYAYGDAVRHNEQALKVQDVLDPDNALLRCDLLLALGEALLPAGENERVARSVAPEALALAEGLGDGLRAARVCVLAMRGLPRAIGFAGGVVTAEYARWAELADRYAPAGSIERLRTDLQVGLREAMLGHQRRAVSRFQQALALARDLGDDTSLCEAAFQVLQARLPGVQQERLRLAEELVGRSFAGVPPRALAGYLTGSALTFTAAGDRAQAEAIWHRQEELAERTRDSALLTQSAVFKLRRLALDGRLTEIPEAAGQLLQRGRDLGEAEAASNAAFVVPLRPLCYLGRPEEARAGQPSVMRAAADAGSSVVFAGQAAIPLVYLGRRQELEPLLAPMRKALADPESAAELAYSPLVNYLEVAVLIQDRGLAAQIVPLLAPAAGLVNEVYLTVHARHMGDACALLGDRDQARAYYDQALAVCARVGLRHEAALTHLGIAELLLEAANSEQRATGETGGSSLSLAGEGRGEGEGRGVLDVRAAPHAPIGGDGPEARAPGEQRAEAMRHLDFAIAEFRDMHMQPALERALRHKEVLKA